MTRRAAAAIRLLAAIAASLPLACGRGSPQGWQMIALGTDAEFEDLCFVDENHGWIVGGSPFVDGGLVGRTTDGGATWTYTSGLVPQRSSATRVQLGAVHFFDASRGVAVGTGGVILHTTDGGKNWRIVSRGGGVTSYLSGLDFIDDRQGWAAGLRGVLETLDGGETWTDLDALGPDGQKVEGRVIHFVDRQNGWLAGPLATLWRTRDGGTRWTPVQVFPPSRNAADLPNLFGMDWYDATTGWIVGQSGTILHTFDGGESWARHDCGVPGIFLTAVQFVDKEQGWTVGFLPGEGRSLVLHTIDGGGSWQVESEVMGEELLALRMLDADHGWAVGDRVRQEPQKLIRKVRPVAP